VKIKQQQKNIEFAAMGKAMEGSSARGLGKPNRSTQMSGGELLEIPNVSPPPTNEKD
jgi:hypothetical protein